MGHFGFRTSNHGPFGWRRVGRSVDFVVALGFLVLLAIAGAVLQYRLGSGRSLVGASEAIDGDSLRLLGEELRLEGIDAPEYRQTCRDRGGGQVACGRQARRALATMLTLGNVSCTVSRADRYGRGLARCRQGDAEINAALVRQGQAPPMAAIRRRRPRRRRRGAASGR